MAEDKPLRRMTPEQIAAASRFAGAEFSIEGTMAGDQLPVLRFHGRIVGADAACLVDSVCRNFDDVAGHMVLDLSDCSFFSSVAIGFVVELAKQRELNGGHLVIAAANRQIRHVIGMLGGHAMFRFCEDVAAALRSAESGRWTR